MSAYQYPKLKIESPNVKYTRGNDNKRRLESLYEYEHVKVERDSCENSIKATPMKTQITFRTELEVPKVGLMLVGLGGNNGTTVSAAILANKHRMSFETKDGLVEANYYGSVTQCSTLFVGQSKDEDFFVPMKDVVPMVNPNDLQVDGWDISSLNLAEAMKRAKVLDVNLQQQLRPMMEKIKPRRGLFDLNFVAENQRERADNIIDPSLSKWQQVQKIMEDIKDFKRSKHLDKVIVLWTANTERFSELIEGVHDSAENLINCLKSNKPECSEISPSTLYALASILCDCTYINGSPQNTFVPALIELAEQRNVFIGGDDFKSGQTKFKSVLVDFLVNAGIKPCSIVSYNHLGNNDGFNLSSPKQFRSKEISKSSVVDDMVHSNQLLFGQGLKKPDHCVVIKYVPYVADSKRALDEYVSELMLGGKNTIVSHNTCEDSLLATPLIIDLVLIAELCERIRFKIHRPDAVAESAFASEFQQFNSVLSVLSYLCKAPLVERGAKVVNALFKQRSCIENLLRALVALPPINHLDFRYKLSRRDLWYESVNRIESIERSKLAQDGELEKLSTVKVSDDVLSNPNFSKPKSASGY